MHAGGKCGNEFAELVFKTFAAGSTRGAARVTLIILRPCACQTFIFHGTIDFHGF
jgi:hypothetical protein